MSFLIKITSFIFLSTTLAACSSYDSNDKKVPANIKSLDKELKEKNTLDLDIIRKQENELNKKQEIERIHRVFRL